MPPVSGPDEGLTLLTRASSKYSHRVTRPKWRRLKASCSVKSVVSQAARRQVSRIVQQATSSDVRGWGHPGGVPSGVYQDTNAASARAHALAALAASADGVGGERHVTKPVATSYVARLTSPPTSAAYIVVRESLLRCGNGPKRQRSTIFPRACRTGYGVGG